MVKSTNWTFSTKKKGALIPRHFTHFTNSLPNHYTFHLPSLYYPSEEIKDNPEDNLSDAEAQKACLEYKSNYNVVVGESWGTLPENLQSRCLFDYHL